MYNVPAILPDSEIRAMQGAAVSLGKKGIPVICLSPDENCLMFKSRLVKEKIRSPSSKDGDEFINFIVERVPRGVLYPSNDRCALLFSQNLERLERAGFLLNLPSRQSFVNGFDKWNCYQKAVSLGLSCAKTHLVSSIDDIHSKKLEIGSPFILKATRLAGGNYIKINDGSEIEKAFEIMLDTINLPENILLQPQLMAQSWLTYEMKDIWCSESYYNKEGKSAGFLTVRKKRTVVYDDGSYGSRLYAGECVDNAELVDLTKKLLDSLNWKGFAHLDWVYIRSEDKFYLMEINPRLPGFSILPFKAGFDMAFYYYSDLLGLGVDFKGASPCLYFEAFRYPGDLSSSFSQIIKRKYSFWGLLCDYSKVFSPSKKIVFDFWCKEDLKISFFNLFDIMKEVLGEFGSYGAKVFRNRK